MPYFVYYTDQINLNTEKANTSNVVTRLWKINKYKQHNEKLWIFAMHEYLQVKVLNYDTTTIIRTVIDNTLSAKNFFCNTTNLFFYDFNRRCYFCHISLCLTNFYS